MKHLISFKKYAKIFAGFYTALVCISNLNFFFRVTLAVQCTALHCTQLKSYMTGSQFYVESGKPGVYAKRTV